MLPFSGASPVPWPQRRPPFIPALGPLRDGRYYPWRWRRKTAAAVRPHLLKFSRAACLLLGVAGMSFA